MPQWICEISGYSTETVLVEAATRREAQQKLERYDFTPVDFIVKQRGKRVVRREEARDHAE